MMIKSHRKVRRKGLALVVVMALVIVLTILAGIILIIARGHYKSTGAQVVHTKAYYLAEAGVQWALWAIRTENLTPPPPGTYTHLVPTPAGEVPVRIEIRPHQRGSPPPGVDWDIRATVDTDDIR